MKIDSRTQLVAKYKEKYYKYLTLSDLRVYMPSTGWVIEKWKDVKGYEGYYAVSTFGRVKSYSRYVYRERFDDYVKRRERILKQKVTTDGYLRVTLQVDKKRKMAPVHILVCRAFVKIKKYKLYVNHKFGNKKDNRASMLEWVTAKENTHHAIRLGIAPSQIGETNNRSKLTEKDVLKIREKVKNGSRGIIPALAKQYNVYHTAIYKIVHNHTWRHI